jgi:hypothetical protein
MKAKLIESFSPQVNQWLVLLAESEEEGSSDEDA